MSTDQPETIRTPLSRSQGQKTSSQRHGFRSPYHTNESRPLRPESWKWRFLIIGLPFLLGLIRIGSELKTYYLGATLSFHGKTLLDYEYLLHLPPGYTSFSKPRPLILFLHGAGELDMPVKHLENVDPVHFAKGKIPKEDFPFIVVSPVTKKEWRWKPEKVKTLLTELLRPENRFKIDPDRIYLTGFSMGGFGTFNVAETFPDLFTAIAPVAGGGDIELASSLKNLPIMAFHGDEDEVINYEYSVKMIEAVRGFENPDAQLVTINGGKHAICAEAYGNPLLYRWFLRHTKQDHSKQEEKDSELETFSP